jgi:hypothetical protein
MNRIEHSQGSPTNKGNNMKNVFALMLAGATIVSVSPAMAASAEAKAAYTATGDKAAADYKVARAKCDGITGNPKDICIAQAKAARIHVEAGAEAQYKDTPGARESARKAIADADYDVEKAKCASQTGNAKDVCNKEAKANMIAAVADATANKKIVDARNDANDDKRSADYNVALEKCDALAGPAKDGCVASAKTQFGK